MNAYTYAMNNPINFRDRDGRLAEGAAFLPIGPGGVVLAVVSTILQVLGFAGIFSGSEKPAFVEVNGFVVRRGEAGVLKAWLRGRTLEGNLLNRAIGLARKYGPALLAHFGAKFFAPLSKAAEVVTASVLGVQAFPRAPDGPEAKTPAGGAADALESGRNLLEGKNRERAEQAIRREIRQRRGSASQSGEEEDIWAYV